MSTKRKIKSARSTPQKFNKLGQPLCRWCSMVVLPPKKTFCSKECIHEWKLRSSPSYARKCVFKRDHGICAECGLDTASITKGFKRPLRGEDRASWKRRVAAQRLKYSIPKHRMTYWEMDHVLAVVENGGECDLKNLQTLCSPCHRIKTNQLMARRRNKKT